MLKPEPSKAWMQTIDGEAFDLMNPKPEAVNWRTVSIVLARIPRFGAHTAGKGIYSVAQHSIEGAHAIMRERNDRRLATIFRLHDAHEFVIGDIAKPVEMALVEHAMNAWNDSAQGQVVLNAIRRLKHVVDRAIFGAARIPFPLDAETQRIIKDYDMRMCRTERDARMAPCDYAWNRVYADAKPIAGCDFHPWHIETVAAIYEGELLDDLLTINS